MNPKIEEIVESLRGCVLDVALTCDKCVATGEMDCNCRSELMLIAADLIDQLQQELTDERYRHDRLQDFCVAQGEELSRLKAQQRWIPVTERLPEDDDDVLIMSSGSISMGYYSTYNEYWADYINVYDDNVTHWMPLPEPPKEDENESNPD